MTRAAAVGAVPWVGAHEDEDEGDHASGGEGAGEGAGEAEGVGGGGGEGGGVAAPPVVLVAGRLAEGHDLAWRRGAARWQSLDAGGTMLAIDPGCNPATSYTPDCSSMHSKLQPYAPRLQL